MKVTKIYFFCFQIERVCVLRCDGFIVVLYVTLYGEQGHMGGRWRTSDVTAQLNIRK